MLLACEPTLQQSGLDYTIMSVPMLNENTGNKSYTVGMVGKHTGTRLSRENAATFILDALDNEQYIHQAPVISD